ncbi:SDR family oxidoreductase [Flavobacterium sp. CLA17]|uniref:SDR family oxidoreductase n=1 Tax=Flavobacterium sp. CLA17 TaxID=2724135 RepID=UPI001491DC63|nr:SDR family oxidoreductase [Flavobacterium sp. CLA17]QSB27954.1 SDR family oxidoreductase [Flavobacterium sp. CLA17]
MSNVLITGGTGKIGSNLVKSMVADGHTVVFTTTDKNKGELLIGQLFNNKNVSYIEVKFENDLSINRIVDNMPFNIDCVIHNARNIRTSIIGNEGKITAEQFSEELFLAVTFPYLLSDSLIDNGNKIKDIIFISSMYGVVVPTPSLYKDFKMQSPVNYGVAKAAQIHLAKEMAVRLANKEVRVNCISYGGVEGRVDDDFLERYKSLTPMNRMLNETDLYPPIQFFLNNKSLAITGENIKIDGGWTIS